MRENASITGEALSSDSGAVHTSYPVTGRQKLRIFTDKSTISIWDDEVEFLREFLIKMDEDSV